MVILKPENTYVMIIKTERYHPESEFSSLPAWTASALSGFSDNDFCPSHHRSGLGIEMFKMVIF